MNDPPVPPAVRDAPWELVEESEETIGSKGPVRIHGVRALYGDRDLRERVRAATGVDREWRSFFASRLTVTPALSSRSADLVVRTIATPVARSRFAGDLRDRGFESVDVVETTTLTVAGGRRGRAVRFSAVIPTEAGPVDAEALLVIWAREEGMVAAGGTYPVGRLRVDGREAGFDPPAEYRQRLVELVRAVE